jgi:RraA family protein
MNNGLRILQRRRSVDLELARQFLDVPVANISDCMSRMTAGGPRLRPMHGSGRMAGSALTVKARPGDNLMIHKALQMAKPGDVIVVDAGGDLTNALIGEIMVGDAVKQGLAGFVMNGAIRDAGAIRQGSFPVFAAGVTHRGPYKDGPGEINVPIAIDGMVIDPGDLIIGDEDGLLCVPFDDVERLLVAAHKKQSIENRMVADIKAGTLDRSWVDATLARLQCFVER